MSESNLGQTRGVDVMSSTRPQAATTDTEAEQPFYVSTVHVRRAGGPDKAVLLPSEEAEVIMGAHGDIAQAIGAPADHPERASTLDYVVGATVACLTGA